MEAQPKFVDSRISVNNKSISFMYLLVQRDKPLPKLVANVALSQYLKEGESMGHLEFKDGTKTNIKAEQAGTVTEIKQIPKSTKDSKIHIFSIKVCQHYPKPKNQSQFTNSQSKLDDVCMFCSKIIQFYYQKQEKSMTFQQLKKQFQHFDRSYFQWKMTLNEQFTRDTEICVMGDQSFYLPETGKVTLMYQLQSSNEDNQWIDPQTVVLRYKKIVCRHEKLTCTQCLTCLTKVEHLKNVQLKRYLFQLDENPNLVLFLSGRALTSCVNQFKERMLKKRKALLILDLDNTILHSISLRRVTEIMISSLDEYVIIPARQTNPLLIQKTLVKFRPNFQYFLAQIVPLYEIFIYTKGTRQYAVQICNAIREKYHKILKETKNFKPYRIISRDQDPSLIKKDLQYMVPQKKDFMLILDDRRDIWNHSPLCIFTKPYVFFYYVAITEDGKTKIEPVQWQKGGGTLNHQLNKFQQNCLKKIDEAQQSGQEEIVKQKLKQLQQQVMHPMAQERIIGTEESPEILQNEINNQKAIKISQKQQEAKNENIIQKKIEKFEASEQQKGRQLKNKGTISDQFLITTAFALKQTHIIYFNKLQLNDDEQRKQGKYADLGNCFQEYKKSILDHLSAYFAFRDYKKSAVFRRAQKLGLRIIQNPQQHIDIIIRPNNFGEGFAQGSEELAKKYSNIFINKVKSISQLKKIPVVSQTWIDTCYEFSCCLQYSKFEPTKPLAQTIMNSEMQLERVVGQATNNASMKIKQILENQNTSSEPVAIK